MNKATKLKNLGRQFFRLVGQKNQLSQIVQLVEPVINWSPEELVIAWGAVNLTRATH